MPTSSQRVRAHFAKYVTLGKTGEKINSKVAVLISDDDDDGKQSNTPARDALLYHMSAKANRNPVLNTQTHTRTDAVNRRARMYHMLTCLKG